MNRYNTPTFYKFLLGFVVILVIAFTTMAVLLKDTPVPDVDNTAGAQ